MSVDLIDDHVLLPHRANYASYPGWRREWGGEVASSEFGAESRYGLRSVPRVGLTWTVTARDLEEQAELIARIAAAAKSGKVCAPYWGRGCELAAAVTADVATLEPTAWPWATGDFAIIIDDDGNYDVREVESFGASALTLASAVSRRYHAGLFVWPLIFGKFSVGQFSPHSTRIGSVELSISELVSAEAETIGTPVPPIDGIGGWIIGDTFIVH